MTYTQHPGWPCSQAAEWFQLRRIDHCRIFSEPGKPCTPKPPLGQSESRNPAEGALLERAIGQVIEAIAQGRLAGAPAGQVASRPAACRCRTSLQDLRRTLRHAGIRERDRTLRPELLQIEGPEQAGVVDCIVPSPIRLAPVVSADSLTCKAGEKKLRLATRRSRLGSSNPVTGGLSGFSTGALWPKAGGWRGPDYQAGTVCAILGGQRQDS